MTDYATRKDRVLSQADEDDIIYEKLVTGIMAAWCFLAFLTLAALLGFAGCAPVSQQQQVQNAAGIAAVMGAMYGNHSHTMQTTSCIPDGAGGVTCSTMEF